ncbi:putative ERG24-C-14 sterol reductase [Violaceomyces palustris]|uniref:ERG24-C-14 sterol reductase n=1 Tax=Violaceomyces palustris TaxID=1673888 RepID=A0ACD0NW43_9BASI|nr:putative ERG24-C-14 sterol reductase [Violaceomyces palustris]
MSSSPSPKKASKLKTEDQLGPVSEHYEFGGPPGALFVTLTVPLFSYLLFYGCSPELGCSPTLPLRDPKLLWATLKYGVLDSFKDLDAWLIYFGWYAFTVLAWAILPGKWERGSELRIGGRLEYKINAFATMLASLAITAGLIVVKGPQGFTFLYDHWAGLVTASIANSVIQAVYCYAVSFQEGKLLALGGNSGNVLYDWFIGRELNPRIGSFDIKTFNELRPGLILWILLDISCACHQYISLNGRLTDSMWLVCAFHTWYVLDALYNESAIFTQMDITTDGFGFMLSVGDLTWVPFVYSLQARYLAFKPVDLGVAGTIGILAVNAIGYYIFRDANGEKNDFRNGSNPKKLKYMTTSTGRKLLTSGWWGRSRHPNYLGDWIMAWAWSLPTGFETPIPYFYVLFFAILLVHRQMRDDEACQKKYGKDWDRYCKLVRSRIIPGIY